MSEVWKEIPETEGRYQASNLGRIRTVGRKDRRGNIVSIEPKLKKRFKNPHGRFMTPIIMNGVCRNKFISRLVLSAFCGPCPKGLEAAHLDGNRTNDRIENLKWVSSKDNNSHKVAHGTDIRGEKGGLAKLTTAQVLNIRDRIKKGEMMTVLAKEFSVSPRAISLIRDGQTWRHLPL